MLYLWLTGRPQNTNWDYYMQLFLAVFLILIGQKKRKGFVWRILLSVVLFFAFGIFVPGGIVLEFDSQFFSVLYSIFYFCSSFFLLVLLMMFSFDISFEESLYASIAAYLDQHMFFELHHILLLCWPYYAENWVLNKLLPTVPTVIVAYLLYREVKKHDGMVIQNQRMFFLAIASLSVNVVFSVIPTQTSTATNDDVFAYLYYMMTIICCLLLLIFLFSSTKEFALQNKVETLNRLWAEDRKNYEIQREEQEAFNRKVHDLKHFIASFEGEIPDESIARMQFLLNQNYPEDQTGLVPLDVVLQSKLRKCHKENIQLTFIGDGRLLSFMEEGAVYSLFANMLDNAIEASKAVTPESKRVISVSITQTKGMVQISSSNYFVGDIKIVNNTIESSSTDKKHHGYGLISIRKIAEHYGGILSLATKDQEFLLSVLFPEGGKVSVATQ